MGLLRLSSLDAWRQRPGCVLRPAMLAVLVCVTYSAMTAAQSGAPTEYQVKAAFLVNFAKFVEWPDTSFADARAPMVLGIVGDDPFGTDLSQMVIRQSIKSRTISIRKYRFGDDLRSCHVLYVSASEQTRTAQVLGGLQGASVLTVSDIPGFVGGGGVVQFYMEEDRVRFVVNVEAAARANLRVSAKLLAVAHVINEARGAR